MRAAFCRVRAVSGALMTMPVPVLVWSIFLARLPPPSALEVATSGLGSVSLQHHSGGISRHVE